jgi:hypothetical protein
VERPERSEKSEKSTSPAMNTRRRPSRSPERPPSSRKPPNVSAYALTTHSRPDVEKWRLFWIDGSATFTIDTSRTTIRYATPSTASACQRLGSGIVAVAGKRIALLA